MKRIYSGVENKLHIIKYRYMKSILVFFLLVPTIISTAPDAKVVVIFESKPINSYDRLVNAVIQVESTGDSLAFNPDEMAVGAFQIRPIRLRDYNERTGNSYKLIDCYKLKISKEIFLYYARKIGYPDYESIARDWNGSGKTTLDYWKRVKSYL
jgi:hypothetical protein